MCACAPKINKNRSPYSKRENVWKINSQEILREAMIFSVVQKYSRKTLGLKDKINMLQCYFYLYCARYLLHSNVQHYLGAILRGFELNSMIYGWVQKIAMRNVSRNTTATYLLYLLVQEFCGKYFCTTMNFITSRSLSSETFSPFLYGDRFV